MLLGKDNGPSPFKNGDGDLKVGIELALSEQDEVVLSSARGEIALIVFDGGTGCWSVRKRQSYLVVRKGRECLVGIRRGSLGSLQERAGGRSNCYSQRRLLVGPVAETCCSIRTGLPCCSGRKKAACSTQLGLSRSRSEGGRLEGVHAVNVFWTMAMGECCSGLSVVTMEESV